MSGNALGQSDPPQRRGSPFRAGRDRFRPVVRKARAHVVKKHVRVWPYQLEALFRTVLKPVCYVRRLVAGCATDFVEDPLSEEDLRVIHIASRGNAKIAAVECHKVKALGIDFMAAAVPVAVRGLPAADLHGGAVAPGVREQGAGYSDVGGKGLGGLFAQGCTSGLVAEAPQHRHAMLDRPDDVRTAGDTVIVGVVRVGVGNDVGCRDGFEQPKTDHLRSDPRAQHRTWMQRPVAEIGRGV